MKKIDYKWTALLLLWVACFLQQGMRQIFPPLASTVGGEFGADAAFRGSVMGVFTLVYALSVPFSGMAGDFLSRKKIVVFSLAVFSLGLFEQRKVYLCFVSAVVFNVLLVNTWK